MAYKRRTTPVVMIISSWDPYDSDELIGGITGNVMPKKGYL